MGGMESVKTPQTRSVDDDANASRVGRLRRLPYRSNLKMADIRKAVKDARARRIAAERVGSEA